MIHLTKEQYESFTDKEWKTYLDSDILPIRMRGNSNSKGNSNS